MLACEHCGESPSKLLWGSDRRWLRLVLIGKGIRGRRRREHGEWNRWIAWRGCRGDGFLGGMRRMLSKRMPMKPAEVESWFSWGVTVRSTREKGGCTKGMARMRAITRNVKVRETWMICWMLISFMCPVHHLERSQHTDQKTMHNVCRFISSTFQSNSVHPISSLFFQYFFLTPFLA